MSIVATVHSCSGGAACDAASTISALVMFGFLVFIAIGLIVAFFGWVKGNAAPPSSPAQRVRPKSQSSQMSHAAAAEPAKASETLKLSGAPEFKKCPDCAEEVRAGALKCRFCDYWFESESASR